MYSSFHWLLFNSLVKGLTGTPPVLLEQLLVKVDGLEGEDVIGSQRHHDGSCSVETRDRHTSSHVVADL